MYRIHNLLSEKNKKAPATWIFSLTLALVFQSKRWSLAAGKGINMSIT